MRTILPFLILCASVLANQRSLPQTAPAPPPPLSDTYRGADAVFTHWSGVDIYPGASADQLRYSVRYTICNLDPKNGLFFLWAKPEILTGFKNPLPPGKCMDSTHDTVKFVADYNAPIIFTQSNQSKNASVYLPVYNDNRDTNSHVRGWFSGGEEGSIIDFSIHMSISSDGDTSYSITWTHGTPIIGVSMDVSKDVLDGVARELSKLSGVNVTVSYANDILTKDDFARLSERASKSSYLEFIPPEQGPRTFEFKIANTHEHAAASGTILFVDKNHQLVFGLPYG
jgi:hypothetical protein